MSASSQFARLFGGGRKASTVQNYLLRSNGVLSSAGLAIDAVAEKFKTTNRTVIRYNGETVGKAATTAIVFTANHVITASKFGVVLVQMSVVAATAIATKVPAATQAYNTAALALAALPEADAGFVAIGYIAIANNAGDWTANTDDLTAASDVTTATFTSFPALTFV